MSEHGAETSGDSADDHDVHYQPDSYAPLPGGGKLYYEEHGAGPAIVTLNNFNIWAPMWPELLGDLVEDHRAICYDLRDQGASESSGPAGIADHVEDLRHLLDHLGVERAFLLSSSTSALIARDFSLAYPDRVSGQIFVGPAISPNGGLRRKLLVRSVLNSLEVGPAEMVEHLYSLVVSDHEIHAGGTAGWLAMRDVQVRLMKPDRVRAGLQECIERDDDPEDLARLGCPVRFIIGDGDFLWSPSVVDDALKLVPNSSARIIDRAGHMPLAEQPEETQADVRGFIREVLQAS